MSEINPPTWQQAGTYPAQLDRLLLDAMGGYSEGIFASGDLQVTQAGTPAMSVVVAAGGVLVQGTDATDQGAYFARNDADVTLSIADSDPTDDRIDIVVARIRDSAYAGATDDWLLEVVTGTAAETPTAPATPESSYVLAEVLVPAGATSITDSEITDKRELNAIVSVADKAIGEPKLDDDSVSRRTVQSGVIVKASEGTPTTAQSVTTSWVTAFQLSVDGGGTAVITGVGVFGSEGPPESAAELETRLLVDGVEVGKRGKTRISSTVTIEAHEAVSDGSHTYELQHRASSAVDHEFQRVRSVLNVLVLP